MPVESHENVNRDMPQQFSILKEDHWRAQEAKFQPNGAHASNKIRTPLSRFQTLILDGHTADSSGQKVHARDGQSGNAKKRCKKQSPKAVPSSLSGIFTKGTAGFNLGKWRTVKTGCANGNGNGSKGGSSLMKAKVELKRDVSRREKKTSREEAKEEGNNREMELCKKRILMGGKCRPLNPSGVLHYDKQGILLPEDE
ncbi:hypothetical protein DH2020_003236 [Rehmannia glutinosa]|uniref:Uncharacterized protein n=1 Tax=Rehmannia glutinosa TaxID=99300 RepID=A0ABR0XL10_REHGL